MARMSRSTVAASRHRQGLGGQHSVRMQHRPSSRLLSPADVPQVWDGGAHQLHLCSRKTLFPAASVSPLLKETPVSAEHPLAWSPHLVLPSSEDLDRRLLLTNPMPLCVAYPCLDLFARRLPRQRGIWSRRSDCNSICFVYRAGIITIRIYYNPNYYCPSAFPTLLERLEHVAATRKSRGTASGSLN
jgi:hypothetical protein